MFAAAFTASTDVSLIRATYSGSAYSRAKRSVMPDR
jgi:hypothetical protein